MGNFSMVKKLSIAIILILIFSVFAVSSNNSNKFKLILKNINPEDKKLISSEIKHPFYHGSDNKNRSYSMSANSALLESDGTVKLKLINAHFEQKGNKDVSALANEALFNTQKKILNLYDNVEIITADNTIIYSNQIYIDIAHSEVYTDKKIIVTGEKADLISYKGMHTSKSGRIVTFHGPIKMTIWNRK